jgi:hypothetical protein
MTRGPIALLRAMLTFGRRGKSGASERVLGQGNRLSEGVAARDDY